MGKDDATNKTPQLAGHTSTCPVIRMHLSEKRHCKNNSHCFFKTPGIVLRRGDDT